LTLARNRASMLLANHDRCCGMVSAHRLWVGSIRFEVPRRDVEADALIEVWRRLVEMINQAELGVGTGRSVVDVALAGIRRSTKPHKSPQKPHKAVGNGARQ
jgi:hypothetical protein